MTKPHNILVAREYTDGNGEVKTEWLRVGVAFPNKKTASIASCRPASA
ncbi:hypothetical protein SAMN02982922_0004 [Mesorhizobium australicum]|uniref:Uncharacterized protein n=1 Tax=Mesorhizobium australicum TaxID=536018 RepID=A0A1X7MPU6_9HYPH|nr:hypothetical protein SAMN02982922_0004 [Mesorhizobium australicum]